MDSTFWIGIFAVGFGLTTLVARFVAPSSAVLGKLEPMKERWGPRGGVAVHWFGYTIVPLVAGTALLWASYGG